MCEERRSRDAAPPRPPSLPRLPARRRTSSLISAHERRRHTGRPPAVGTLPAQGNHSRMTCVPDGDVRHSGVHKSRGCLHSCLVPVSLPPALPLAATGTASRCHRHCLGYAVAVMRVWARTAASTDHRVRCAGRQGIHVGRSAASGQGRTQAGGRGRLPPVVRDAASLVASPHGLKVHRHPAHRGC